ncbi:MAG: glycosyltransferase family 9 protein [Thermodesulfobacteriota bacterium]
MPLIHYDCRHFKGDIPCKPHKEYGVHCKGCSHYDSIEYRILIVKLDAIGDVLRTTSILPGLKECHPASRITWLTRIESISIFNNNPFVDVVLDCSAESLLRIMSERYDLVINLDASPTSSVFATLAKGEEKKGFLYDEKGYVYPANKEAEGWFEMGIFDDVKRTNRRTYQTIMLDILGITPSDYEIVFRLDEKEKEFAGDFAGKHGLSEKHTIIGINTGAGRRWEQKKWTVEGIMGLIDLIKKGVKKPRILLYGGPEEVERNRYLLDKCGDLLIDTGCNNSIREFAALIDLSDILVTGDTMALHIAVALKKKVVALFGPTSHAEIDLYGRGKKVYADMDCLCCYKKTCKVKPSCMETITPEIVYKAVQELLLKTP